MYDQLDSSQQGNGKNKENRGHLEFEITSDDGFTCKSDTIDGKEDCYMNLITRKLVFGVSYQIRLKLACAATEVR